MIFDALFSREGPYHNARIAGNNRQTLPRQGFGEAPVGNIASRPGCFASEPSPSQ
jgi:hypothetical protein